MSDGSCKAHFQQLQDVFSVSSGLLIVKIDNDTVNNTTCWSQYPKRVEDVEDVEAWWGNFHADPGSQAISWSFLEIQLSSAGPKQMSCDCHTLENRWSMVIPWSQPKCSWFHGAIVIPFMSRMRKWPTWSAKKLCVSARGRKRWKEGQ